MDVAGVIFKRNFTRNSYTLYKVKIQANLPLIVVVSKVAYS